MFDLARYFAGDVNRVAATGDHRIDDSVDYEGDGYAGDASTTEMHEFLQAVREGDPDQMRPPYHDGLRTLAVNLAADREATIGC